MKSIFKKNKPTRAKLWVLIGFMLNLLVANGNLAGGQTSHDLNINPMQLEKIKERLYNDVEKITSIRPFRNFANVNSLNAVAEYIFMEFDRLEGNPVYQEFIVDGNTYKNVIATFGPKDGPRVVVGAHYDVAGDQPGADDNASAVAGLMELARMVANPSQPLKHRIDFVAYSLEEPPFFATDQMGSAVHAKYLHDNNIAVKYMVCLEMIGYYSDKPNSQGFPSDDLKSLYPSTGNFVILVGKTGQERFTENVKIIMKNHAKIDVQSINLPTTDYLAGLSDHRNYWKYGYNAVMINDTSFLRNPHYHKKSDTIETLDFDKMTEVVIGAYHVIIEM
ncbi:MAG: M28 family peptidase [Bacteroidota bacterium]|nr:M28 family peptidase [Bacteroidota bacterium]